MLYEVITTLERYIILQKIERIKQLIDNNEHTLSEISYMMDYSSVQYRITSYNVCYTKLLRPQMFHLQVR